VFTAVLVYGGLALVDSRPWPQTFAFEGDHVFWFCSVVVPGQLSAFWSSHLASRARLFQLIEGLPSGPLLEQRIHDFQLDANFSNANEAALQWSTGILVVLAAAAVVLSPLGKFAVFWGAGFFCLAFFISALLRLYRREMESFVYGRRLSVGEKLSPLGATLLILLLSVLGAALLLPLGGPWVDWNLVFQGHPGLTKPVTPPVHHSFTPLVDRLHPADYFGAVVLALLQILLGFRRLVTVLAFVLSTAPYLLLAAAALFVLWPLAHWILTGGRQTQGLFRHWWVLMKAQLRAFLALLGRWRRTPPEAQGERISTTSPLAWLRSWFRRPAGGGRKPYAPVVEAFLSLVRWAEPLTAYRQGETFREFLDRLGALLPEHAAALGRLRDQLDQELFGPRPLDAEERRSFLAEAQKLLLTKPSPDGEGFPS